MKSTTDETVTFDDLIAVYRHTEWGENARQTRVHLVNDKICDIFLQVNRSDLAARDTDLVVLSPMSDVVVGNTIRAHVGIPRIGLGILAEDWDGLLESPKARIAEPNNYFVKFDNSQRNQDPPTSEAAKYRRMLELFNLIRPAALFVDEQRQVLVFYKDSKIEIPVRYTRKDLFLIDDEALIALRSALDGDLHKEQRLDILSEAVVSLATPQPENNRWVYLAQNAGELVRSITDGYRLFATSFSYSKIRGEIEAAQLEYTNKIHKTFVDIQGQLLGLPVATVIVATQIKAVKECGAEAWGNLAVVFGAWLFAALLIASCANQWFTLNAIRKDIQKQENKFRQEFREISHQFEDIFESLNLRISWHKWVMFIISVISIAGAMFATFIYTSVTGIAVMSICVH